MAGAVPPTAAPALAFPTQTAASAPTRYVTATPEVQSSYPIETQLQQLQALQTQLQQLRDQAMQSGLPVVGLQGGPPAGVPVGGAQFPVGANYYEQQATSAPPGNLLGGGAHGAYGAHVLNGPDGRMPGAMQAGMQAGLQAGMQAGLQVQGQRLQGDKRTGPQGGLQGGLHAGLQDGLYRAAGMQVPTGMQAPPIALAAPGTVAGMDAHMGFAASKAPEPTPRAEVSAALADVEAELEAQLQFALGGNSQLPSPSQPTRNAPKFTVAEIAAYAQPAAPIGTSSGHAQAEPNTNQIIATLREEARAADPNPTTLTPTLTLTSILTLHPQRYPYPYPIHADLADQVEADLAQDQGEADLAGVQAGAGGLPADAPMGAGATSTNELSEDAAEVCKSSRAVGGIADASLDISQASSVGTVVTGDNGPASTLTVAAKTDEEQKPMPDDDVLEACSAPAPPARSNAHTAPLTAPSSASHALPAHCPPPMPPSAPPSWIAPPAGATLGVPQPKRHAAHAPRRRRAARPHV